MNKFRYCLVVFAAAAGATACLAIWHAFQIKFRANETTLRRQAAQIGALTVDNDRLAEQVAQMKISRALPPDQQDELLSLRNQAGQLRGAVQARSNLLATNVRLHAAREQLDKQITAEQAASNYWPKNRFSFAGFETPEAAAMSLLWALQSGDLSALKSVCTPRAQAQLEQALAQGDPSKISEFKAGVERAAQALLANSTGVRLVGQTMPTPDEAIISLSFIGEGRVRKFTATKIGNEWKFDNPLLEGQSESPW